MNILLLLIILISFYLKDFKKLAIIAFILGLINDLYRANLIGLSSLIFIVIIFLLHLYAKKFSLNHIIFQLAFIFFSNSIYTFIFSNNFSLRENLILLGISLIIILIINKIKGGQKQITVE